MTSLPLTQCLSKLAAEQGVDLTSLAIAEVAFEKKLAALRKWVAETRPPDLSNHQTSNRRD